MGKTDQAPDHVTVEFLQAGGESVRLADLGPEFMAANSIPAVGNLGAPIRRIRLIWNSSHTLGWIALVKTRAPEIVSEVAPSAAFHSSGARVDNLLSSKDRRVVQLLPGEHVDLEFKSGPLGSDMRLVLKAYGRYDRELQADHAATPHRTFLAQNRPNPFNPETRIDFGLAERARVVLRIYDVSGRLVRGLIDSEYPAGFYGEVWNARDGTGRSVASGVYFYELRVGSFVERRKMILLR